MYYRVTHYIGVSLLTAVSVFVVCVSWSTPLHAGLLGGGASVSGGAKQDTSPWLMTYYVGYQYAYVRPRDVDYSLMTHLVVGSVGVGADGTLREHWSMPQGGGRTMALDVGRRAEQAGVKRLIWLGGPDDRAAFASSSSDRYRATFVRNIVALVATLDYDGVDIDWEPLRAADGPLILALVRDLRAAAPNLLITVPVDWVTMTRVGDRSLYPKLAAYADKIFVMSYSMAGSWGGWKTWHGSALAGEGSSTPSSVRSSIDAYLRAGVPKGKLGIGIGTYATCWEYPVRRPGERVPAAFMPADVHTMSMGTLFDDYYLKKYEKWDSAAQVPYLSFPKARGDLSCGFVSYENARSVTAKAQYVIDQGLGGALVWNVGTGYLPDASRSKRHELLKATSDTLR